MACGGLKSFFSLTTADPRGLIFLFASRAHEAHGSKADKSALRRVAMSISLNEMQPVAFSPEDLKKRGVATNNNLGMLLLTLALLSLLAGTKCVCVRASDQLGLKGLSERVLVFDKRAKQEEAFAGTPSSCSLPFCDSPHSVCLRDLCPHKLNSKSTVLCCFGLIGALWLGVQLLQSGRFHTEATRPAMCAHGSAGRGEAQCICMTDSPVCGSDGITYSCPCDATENGITSFTNGSCPRASLFLLAVSLGMCLGGLQSVYIRMCMWLMGETVYRARWTFCLALLRSHAHTHLHTLTCAASDLPDLCYSRCGVPTVPL
jgi:hypothetical protein